MPDIDFPTDVPEPGTMVSGEAAAWYLSATKRILDFVSVDGAGLSDLESAWSAKSRLRYAAAMAMIDQDAAAEFMRTNPIPSLDSLLDLAQDESTADPVAGTLQLLLQPSDRSADEGLRVYNENVAYADAVMPQGQSEMRVKSGDGWTTVRAVLPPRPIVPNPEYIENIEPFFTVASVWEKASRIGSPDSELQEPCVLEYGGSLWVGYLKEPDNSIAVVRFSGYVEHQVSRVGKLLESHPYFNAGLTPRAFNELSTSLYTKYWSRFAARHWVVNFPDRTMDIIAKSAEVVGLSTQASSTFGCVKHAIETAD